MTRKARIVKENRRNKVASRELKTAYGEQELISERSINNEDFVLNDFHFTHGQQRMAESFYEKSLVAVQGSAGTGKSTTAVYLGLRGLKDGTFRKIINVKSPTESSDDAIGFLQGGLNDKLAQHFEAMRGVYYNFMSKRKLEMEEKHERIQFKIPNFVQGDTYDDTLLIFDEGQNVTPKILKLVLERIGKNSKILLLGDIYQEYAFRKRENGFADFVKLITKENNSSEKICIIPNMDYVVLPNSENMRSELSRQVVQLYENKYSRGYSAKHR